LLQVWIVTEDGEASSSHCPINRPAIAATQHTKAAQLLELLVLFLDIKVDTTVFNSGGDNQRVALVIACFQFSGTPGTQFGNDAGTNHFGFPVAGQVPAHHLGPLNTILNSPGSGLETQQGKFKRKIIQVVFNESVDALRVGMQDTL